MDVETSLDIEEMRRRIQQGINRCCEQLLEIAMILTHKGGQVLNRLKGASFPELAQNSENIGNGSMSENQNQRLDPMTSAQYQLDLKPHPVAMTLNICKCPPSAKRLHKNPTPFLASHCHSHFGHHQWEWHVMGAAIYNIYQVRETHPKTGIAISWWN